MSIFRFGEFCLFLKYAYYSEADATAANDGNPRTGVSLGFSGVIAGVIAGY
ncbi:MAG: hypothetical protein FWE74_08325 [Oscillospiraceae bacterium]|nr:hypothetical protein [Oscillospiraceae bacterium]